MYISILHTQICQQISSIPAETEHYNQAVIPVMIKCWRKPPTTHRNTDTKHLYPSSRLCKKLQVCACAVASESVTSHSADTRGQIFAYGHRSTQTIHTTFRPLQRFRPLPPGEETLEDEREPLGPSSSDWSWNIQTGPWQCSHARFSHSFSSAKSCSEVCDCLRLSSWYVGSCITMLVTVPCKDGQAASHSARHHLPDDKSE